MQRTSPPRYRPPLKPQQSVSETTSGSFVGRCPHLGTAADSGTALAFASDANQCYRTRLPVPISMVHQQNYCLSSDYAECPVYQQNLRFAEAAPLVTAPPSWLVEDTPVVTDVVIAPSRQQNSRSPILPILLLLVLLAGGWWLWRGYLSQPDPAAEQSQQDLAIGEATPVPPTLPPNAADSEPGAGVAVAVIAPTETPQPTAAPPTAEATDASPRGGISLPAIPTASAVPAGEGDPAADCASPEWWVPYTVVADDTMLLLAQIRGLTEDDVLAGNCLEDSELTAGQTILLPPLAVVIAIPPTSTGVAPAATITRTAPGSAVQPTAASTATTAPTIAPSPTPFPTSFPTSFPDDPPGATATSQPPTPTSVSTTVPRATQTATAPAVGPSPTPVTPRATVTPASFIPTATPPPTATFERPTQTPPPVP